MISQQLNDSITRVGPDSAAGAVLRCYWQPAALIEELEYQNPAPVNLLGERLALWRDDTGSFVLAARKAEAGEPSVYHPGPEQIEAEPGGAVYPVVEKKGVVFAYLGDGPVPEFPNLDCFRADDSHVFAFKGLWECNWLQALEIGIDPAHASFLHRFLEDEDPDEGYGKQFRDQVANTNIPMTRVLREFPRPQIEVDETNYGLKITALRHLENGQTHVRVTNQIFPEAICIPMSREMTITQWHVPVDDETCYWMTMFTSFRDPVNKALMREQRLEEHVLPTYAPLKHKGNHYGYDPKEQESVTYTGMGLDINVHDQWAVEGMGAIQDRTQEHLGRSDVAIIRYRRMLREAIAALDRGDRDALPMQGEETSGIIGPLSNDTIAPTANWSGASREADLERRSGCPWDASV
ncbi:aromatic ring-hydroxylating dioxygenase subunit alpha [Shimia abyssi]|uniref:Phenylpropionate dioxygenase-like ring-hydroxylating dioxygenase large terminal subunit n=1 Tax=Shimia abyssi TaxID=1662395 RepID=A0A2P8F5W2_9RHOB|nr:aromatic ring-hydroxylating dioxygenase subunit alpha [Shimia abyssi]PSL17099.1 phenylpropionate dioxygenase-like ring-hydroxylating dioxygenase large terminal subunit [Shimia abyssi]